MTYGTLLIEYLLNSTIHQSEHEISSHQEGPVLYIWRLNICNLKGSEDAYYGQDLQDEDNMFLSNSDIDISY